jgi:hypothetical protein
MGVRVPVAAFQLLDHTTATTIRARALPVHESPAVPDGDR